jgi:hypothetical protein
MFEGGGVAVTDKPASRLVSPTYSLPSKAEILRRGAEALERLARRADGEDWNRWIEVMQALDIGRTEALHAAGKNKANGYHYNQAFAKWLRLHPAFEQIDKADRSRFHECFRHLDEITAWRATLSPAQQLKLNYPPLVLARWKRSKSDKSSPEPEADAPDVEFTEEAVTAWLIQATPEVRRHIRRQLFPDIGASEVQSLLALMPTAIHAELEGRLENLILNRLADAGKPDPKLTKLILKAVLLAKSARDPDSSGTMRNANVEELLSTLSCIEDTVRKTGFPFQNLSVRLARTKGK